MYTICLIHIGEHTLLNSSIAIRYIVTKNFLNNYYIVKDKFILVIKYIVYFLLYIIRMLYINFKEFYVHTRIIL